MVDAMRVVAFGAFDEERTGAAHHRAGDWPAAEFGFGDKPHRMNGIQHKDVQP